MNSSSSEEVLKECMEQETSESKLHLRELLLVASSLYAIAEEEVQGWIRKLIEKKDIEPEERTKLLHEIRQRQKEATAVIERWIEDRIKRAYRTLPNSFQRELHQSQKRVRHLGERVQRLSEKVKSSGAL